MTEEERLGRIREIISFMSSSDKADLAIEIYNNEYLSKEETIRALGVDMDQLERERQEELTRLLDDRAEYDLSADFLAGKLRELQKEFDCR